MRDSPDDHHHHPSSSVHPHHRSSSSSSSAASSSAAAAANARTSLADDISAIRQALEGASSVARERTLKILQRLTARLHLAESDRDLAVGELMALQKRYRAMEGELQKKRAELRELLRQETAAAATNGNGAAGSGGSSSATPTPTPTHGVRPPSGAAGPVPSSSSAAATATNPDNGMSGSQRSSVTLEILQESAEISRAAATRSAGSSLSAGAEAASVSLGNNGNGGGGGSEGAGSTSGSGSASRLSSSLPKMDLKNPAKVLQDQEEKELINHHHHGGGGGSSEGGYGRSSSVRSSLSDKVISASSSSANNAALPPASAPSPALSAPSPLVVPASVALSVHHRPASDFVAAAGEHPRLSAAEFAVGRQQQQQLPQRHRSGTPTSTRSRVRGKI